MVSRRRRRSAGLAALSLVACAAAPATAASFPALATGCRAAHPHVQPGRDVALAFADGPGPYTPAVLSILERERVPGTFFVIGDRIHGREAVLRRVLTDGGVLGNHTFTHRDVSRGGERELRWTQEAIHHATGYTPCLFRPPHDKAGPRLIAQALSLGLVTVGRENVVEAKDYARPGSDGIYGRVVGRTIPGSVILFHDAGGWPEQALAALPRIIATLRRRGYGFRTVPQLLGLWPRYERLLAGP